MSLKEAYLIEIQRETENTRKMLSVIKDEHLSYKPHEKSMSLGDLAAHIAELHNWVHHAISKDTFDFHVDYQRPTFNSAQDILDILNNNYQKNIDQINAMSDADWMGQWTLKAGEHVIMQMPKVGAMRFIIQNHLIHHRGQLSVYLRMNDVPIPGMYGPSADEK